MRCALLCIPEAVEGGLCLLEMFGGVRGAGGAGAYAPCAALYAGGSGGWAMFAGGVVRCCEVLEGLKRAGGDAQCAALYPGGCGGCALLAGGAGGNALCAALYIGGCGE